MDHMCKRPGKCFVDAETLAAAESIDEGKYLEQTMLTLLGLSLRLLVALDCHDLFTSLGTKQNSIDRSFRDNVNIIRY